MRLNWRVLWPGVLISILVALAAVAGGAAEEHLLGRAIIEALVLAILIGMAVCTAGGVSPRQDAGIRFVGKEILEVAVFLLGATMDIPRLFASGPWLAFGIVGIVCVSLVVSYGIGRGVGLTPRLAVLVACGNSICGNSAIAAVAPVIGAEREDVAASIALTAVLGVLVVLGLPLLMIPLHYSNYQYGVLAGLTVYAVPQVLAAAFAVSVLSGQVATAVKLGRVLMLGPVVMFFSLIGRRDSGLGAPSDAATSSLPKRRASLVPWFVTGFVVLAALRSTHVIPDVVANEAKLVAGWLTIAAMAGLGLSVDLRSVRRVGSRVATAVAGSLIALIATAILLIRVLALR